MLRRIVIAGVLLVGMSALTASMTATTAIQNATPVTFTKDVLPILQNNCQNCHRPGEIGPMSFITYSEVRPWARAIKNAVVTRKMPPWFAEPGHSDFANDNSLSAAEIKILADWVDAGAVEGNPKDAPAPLTFVDGWNIKPDMVIEMPLDVPLPATGTINYKTILVKANFPEDMWVVAAEMRAGDRAAVHHMRAIVRPPGSDWMKNAIPGVAYEGGDPEIGRQTVGTDLLGKYNPGLGGQDFGAYESAKFVPKGSDVVFSMHYTATGKVTTDRSKVGLVFAKNNQAPKYRYFVSDGPTASNLAVPPNDPKAQVVSEMTAVEDTQLVYFQPHMHVRGTDMEIRLFYPGSSQHETVFRGKWDYMWQQGFDLEKPIPIPKGTRIMAIAHYDNSANNKSNPDPSQLVFWGPQNWDEMQNCFMAFLVDPKHPDPKKLFIRSGPSLLPRGTSGPTLQSMVTEPAK